MISAAFCFAGLCRALPGAGPGLPSGPTILGTRGADDDSAPLWLWPVCVHFCEESPEWRVSLKAWSVAQNSVSWESMRQQNALWQLLLAAGPCAREDALDVAMGPRFAELVERSFKRDT